MQIADKKLPHGSRKCQCAPCGRYFGGLRAFDLHRQGPANARFCVDPAGLTDKDGKPLLTEKNGYWVREYK